MTPIRHKYGQIGVLYYFGFLNRPNNMSQTYLFSEPCITISREIIFKSTPLGKLKEVLPLSSLVNLLPSKCNPAGAKPWFNPEGMLGLMFLKSYTELSDSFLIEQLNGNWHMQFFCGIQLADNEQIRDASIVSRIRSYIAKHIDMSVFQKDLVSTWEVEMDQTHLNMQDATVYESYIKYPTDVIYYGIVANF